MFPILIMNVTSSRFCLYLLNIYHFSYTFLNAHTEAHTHSTHVQSAHKKNGDTFHVGYLQLQPRDKKRLPAGHRSLVERGGRKALLETLHTKNKMSEKTDIRESRKRARRASSQATGLFLKK